MISLYIFHNIVSVIHRDKGLKNRFLILRDNDFKSHSHSFHVQYNFSEVERNSLLFII